MKEMQEEEMNQASKILGLRNLHLKDMMQEDLLQEDQTDHQLQEEDTIPEGMKEGVDQIQDLQEDHQLQEEDTIIEERTTEEVSLLPDCQEVQELEMKLLLA